MMALPAHAQTCPDPDDMADVLTELAPIEFKPTTRIPDFPIWPFGGDPGACDNPATTGATWCAASKAYTPPASVTRREHLVLWLPGQGNYPDDTDFVPQTAAFAGYRTINLAWDNPTSITGSGGAGAIETWCRETDGGSLLGGDCSSGCLLTTAQEMTTGVDDGDTDYPAHPMHGIEGRLKLALEHLHVLDFNEDGDYDHNWDAFCDEDNIHWKDIEVAGFSEGGQLAMYISYLAPRDASDGGNTIGLLAADGGAPVCDHTFTSSTSGTYYPDEMDDTGTDPCGASACPTNNRFMFIHNDGAASSGNGLISTFFDWVDTGLLTIGFTATSPVYLDADVEAGTFALGTTHNFFRTDQITVTGEHGSMAADDVMPNGRTGGSQAGDASEYFLMPAYLQAFCELDQ